MDIKARNWYITYSMAFLFQSPNLSSSVTAMSKIITLPCNFKMQYGLISSRSAHMEPFWSCQRLHAPPHHSLIHCSPILTRPKDQGKWRVILDLSYRRGLALNDQFDQVRSRFDGDLFCPRFPSIDDIVKQICSHKDDVLISKIDVARACRNLHVDPADALNSVMPSSSLWLRLELKCLPN